MIPDQPVSRIYYSGTAWEPPFEVDGIHYSQELYAMPERGVHATQPMFQEIDDHPGMVCRTRCHSRTKIRPGVVWSQVMESYGPHFYGDFHSER